MIFKQNLVEDDVVENGDSSSEIIEVKVQVANSIPTFIACPIFIVYTLCENGHDFLDI